MTKFLLDTHVIVWLAFEPARIPSALRERLEGASELAVSAASGYEVAQKARSGKLPSGTALLARWPELMRSLVATELPLSVREMTHAGAMLWMHRDPFDRMLVAQAQLGGYELVTADAAIRENPAVTCAPWE